MADDTTSLNEKHLPETPRSELNFLNSEDDTTKEARREAVPIVPRREAAPGRRPLFRN